MNYIVTIEGKQIPVPEEIGKDDEAVKRALAPFYPDAANAMITRVEEGETVKITVVKRAGTKGLLYLQECKGGKNPAVELYEELVERDQEGLDLDGLLAMDAQIGVALEDGEKEFRAVGAAYQRLRAARPQPAPELVLGF